MAQTLVISCQPVVEGHVLAKLLQGGITSLDSVSYVTNSSALPEGALPSEKYAVAFSFAKEAGSHDAKLLAELFRSLKLGAALTIIERDSEDPSLLEKRLVLAGFMGCKRAVSPNGDAMVEAHKPTWQTGSSAPLDLAKLRKQKDASDTTAPQKLRLDLEEGDDADDLVDEDALLTEEDRQRPAAAVDCGTTTTKKACKDCTCGRAEGKMEKVDLTPEMLQNPQSGCGSCGLGDAFRCQTCPYRGLPAFEKGKRIELPQDFLTADA